jgi:hypothetical protein
MLEKINESMGGRWLLIECGTYLDHHPLAGRPARALVHVALCNLTEFPGVSDKPKAKTSKERQSERYAVHVLKEPTPIAELPPGSTPMLHYAPFELDGNGHLTGGTLLAKRWAGPVPDPGLGLGMLLSQALAQANLGHA